jgi:hypothetical protein
VNTYGFNTNFYNMTSTNQGPRRIGQWLYLKPESIEEYKKCHAAVWPEVLEQIKDSNIRDCDTLFPRSRFLDTYPLRLHLPVHGAPSYVVCELQVRWQRIR